MDIQERPHSKYSPSRLAMMTNCLGWVSSDIRTIASERGTEIGERIGQAVVELSPEFLEENELKAYNKIMEFIPVGIQTEREKWLDTKITDVSGYADIAAIDEGGMEAYLVEIKTGFGNRQDAKNNIQVLCYSLGLLKLPVVATVKAIKVEVDRGETSEAEWTSDDIGWMEDTIKKLIEDSKECTPKQYNCGTYCKYCGRATVCPQLGKHAETAIAAVPQNVSMDKGSISNWANNLTPESIGRALDEILPKCDLAAILAGAIKARAHAMLEAGLDVPGWTLEKKFGHRAWVDIGEAEKTLVGLNGGLPDGILVLDSPARVERALKGRVKKCDINDLTYRPETNKYLTRKQLQ